MYFYVCKYPLSTFVPCMDIVALCSEYDHTDKQYLFKIKKYLFCFEFISPVFSDVVKLHTLMMKKAPGRI